MKQDQELLQMVQTLSEQVQEMAKQIKSLQLINAQDVPEEIRVAIAAGIAAYLGYLGEQKVTRLGEASNWTKGTRVAQLNHIPVR